MSREYSCKYASLLGPSFEGELMAKERNRQSVVLPSPELPQMHLPGEYMNLVMNKINNGVPLSTEEQQALYQYGAKTAQKEGTMKTAQKCELFMQKMQKEAFGTRGVNDAFEAGVGEMMYPDEARRRQLKGNVGRTVPYVRTKDPATAVASLPASTKVGGLSTAKIASICASVALNRKDA